MRKIKILLMAALMGLTATSPAMADSDPEALKQADSSKILLKAPQAPEHKQWHKGDSLHSPTKEVSIQLNPITIGLCNAGFGDKRVETFDSQHDGEITLYCGDSASGYVHIREQHESQWEDQKGGFEGYWDDYMVFATNAALESPSYSTTRPNQKRCYTTPIEVYEIIDGVPVKKKTIHPTIMISVNNKKVITSYPTTNHRC